MFSLREEKEIFVQNSYLNILIFFFFALISNVTNVPDHRHYRIQMNKSTTLMLKLGL